MFIRRFALASVLSLVLTACHDEEPIGPGLAAVDITPDSVLLLAGDSMQLSITVLDRVGQTVTDPQLTWVSSDTAIASVRAGGFVIGRAAGTAIITARSTLASGTSKVVIEEPIGPGLAAVDITPDSVLLLAGDSMQLSSTVLDRVGQIVTDPQLTWVSSDTAIASVRAGGFVIGRAAGTATITARSTLASGTSKVVIKQIAGCEAAGIRHAGVIGDEVWTSLASPHIVVDSVVIGGRLSIEAGALVCALAGAFIAVRNGGELSVEGRAERRVRLTAADPAKPWAGIRAGSFSGDQGSGSVVLRFADVELAGAVTAGYTAGLDISDSNFRRTSIFAASNFAALTLRRSVVDTGSVSLSAGTFENSIIRAGSLTLAHTQPGGRIKIDGGRIEGSPGIALGVSTRGGIPPSNIEVARTLRIIGSRGNPVSIPIELFQLLWPTPEAQDSLLGNFNDSLVISSGGLRDVYIRRELPWHMVCGLPICWEFAVNALTMEAGAGLKVGLPIAVSGKVTAIGSRDATIAFSSFGTSSGPGPPNLRLKGTAQSEFSHVVFSGVSVSTEAQHVVNMQRIRTDALIDLRIAGSTISNAEFFNVRGHSWLPPAALRLGAPGLRADRIIVRRAGGFGASVYPAPPTPVAGVIIDAADVQLLDCDVSDNASDGIRVLSGANVQIHGCNIERNGGFGVVNLGTSRVDARRNWWGDRAGPAGPMGDGVSGDVEVFEVLTAPRAPLARPASITLSSSRQTVGTADTLRLSATVRDSAGNMMGPDLLWRLTDPSIAFFDPNEEGLLVGARTGTTTITVMAASDTTVRASANIVVTPAAPLFRWTTEPVGTAKPNRVWGSALDDIYLAAHPHLVHFDGNQWSTVVGGPSTPVTRISGTSATSVFGSANDQGAGGSELWHFNGSVWNRSTAPSLIQDLVAVGPNDVIVFTEKWESNAYERAVYRYHDGVWTLLFRPLPTYTFARIWARSASDIYIGGENGLQHWNGQTVAMIAGSPQVDAITGTDRYVYVVAYPFDPVNSTYPGRAYRYDGSGWDALAFSAVQRVATDLDAFSDARIVAVGDGVQFFDGQRWWPVWTGTKARFHSAWIFDGDVYLTGTVATDTGGVESVLLHGRRED